MNYQIPNDWQEQLSQNGHFLVPLVLDDTLEMAVKAQNWSNIDQTFMELTSHQGELFKILSQFEEFKGIEFIISIRDANNPWEEEGIWHDDGSRKLAFSLSLCLDPQSIEGGVLEIRKKGDKVSLKIPPFPFGHMVVFATGTSGFEHKINQVTKNVRTIIAGWCQ